MGLTSTALVGVALVAVSTAGIVWVAVSKLIDWLAGRDWFQGSDGESRQPETGSDVRGPDGFVQHLEMICETAKTAPSSAQITYAMNNLTRAEVLESEVERLSEHEVAS